MREGESVFKARFRKMLILVSFVFCSISIWNCAKADDGISAALIQLASNEEVLSLYSNETGNGYFLTTNALYQISVHEGKGNNSYKVLCENTNYIAAFENRQQVFLLSANGELVAFEDGQFDRKGQIPLESQMFDNAPINFCIGNDTLYFTFSRDAE